MEPEIRATSTAAEYPEDTHGDLERKAGSARAEIRGGRLDSRSVGHAPRLAAVDGIRAYFAEEMRDQSRLVDQHFAQ